MTFDKVYAEILDNTVVSKQRCRVLYDCLMKTFDIPGDIAEVGVYRGGTLRLLASLSPHKIVHGFDTFCGMPQVDAAKDNHHKEGNFSETSYENVKNFLKDVPNIVLYKGIFPHTTANIIDIDFSFVHIDADIYPSVLAACNFFYPRMSPGGIIISDDYGSLSCVGAKIAMDEFFSRKPEQITRGFGSQAMVRVNGVKI